VAAKPRAWAAQQVDEAEGPHGAPLEQRHLEGRLDERHLQALDDRQTIARRHISTSIPGATLTSVSVPSRAVATGTGLPSLDRLHPLARAIVLAEALAPPPGRTPGRLHRTRRV
jgi:hypothetical protein